MPDKNLGGGYLLRLTKSSQFQPRLRGRIAGSFPEQRLVIEPIIDQNGMDFVTEISFCKTPVANRHGLKVS